MRPFSLRTPRWEFPPLIEPEPVPSPNADAAPADESSLPSVRFFSSTTQMIASLKRYTKNSRRSASRRTDSRSYIWSAPSPESGWPFQSMMRFRRSSVIELNGESSSCWMISRSSGDVSGSRDGDGDMWWFDPACDCWSTEMCCDRGDMPYSPGRGPECPECVLPSRARLAFFWCGAYASDEGITEPGTCVFCRFPGSSTTTRHVSGWLGSELRVMDGNSDWT